MARHKKRRPAPAPEPGGAGGGTQGAGGAPEAPAAAPPGPAAEAPGAEAAPYKKKLDRLFWLRVCLAVAAGAAATFVFEPVEGEERRWASIGFMVALFAVTVGIGRGMRMQLPSSDRKKLVTQGIGSYVFLYLFTWIVTYTLANLAAPGGAAPPIP